jgi:hypothetical protein
MATNTLTRVRYAGLDFDTHEDEILARLQVKFASVFNDFAVSSLGIMLVDIFSFGLDTLSFYLDRRATDNFMVTARTRASAARLARQLGYRPGPASASSVDLNVSLGRTYAFPVTVPIGFQFQGPNGLIFEAQESVTFSVGDTSIKTLTASEGETLTATFFSNAEANQVFDIGNIPSGQFVVGKGTTGQSRTIVEVDGDAWAEQEFLQFGDTNQFEMGYVDAPPTVRFGDGIAGKIPENGAEIRVSYFASTGVGGAATAGTITRVNTPLVISFQQINLIVTNPEGTSGGSDPESLSSIKSNAPSVFKSRNVNVTLEDYEARSQSFVDPVFGAIAVARAINVRGASDDAFLSSRLTTINAESESYQPTVDAAVAAILASLALIDTSVTGAQTDDTTLQSSIAAIISEEANARTANEASRTAAGVAQANSSSVSADLSSLTAAINAFAVAGTTQITTIDKNVLLNLINAATAKNNEVSSQASTVLSNVTTATTALDAIDAQADVAEIRRAAIRADVNAISVQSTAAGSSASGLSISVAAIENTITTLTGDIATHVDSFLSNECKSNLIEVPVLTLDSEGFYVVPTNGLQKSLQAYLDGAKEVTQVVKVTGVSSLLVAANISVLVGVLTGYNEATVRSQVEAAILNVLRGRAFGNKLRLSELYAPVAPELDNVPIEGVEYVNIVITGPVDHLDTDDGLAVSEYEVVTRGTITVTSEIVNKSLVGQ